MFHREKPHPEHEEGKEGREKLDRKGAGIPIDTQKQSPAETVLQSRELFKSNYTLTHPSAPEHPDQKATWRYLSWPHQREYTALPEGMRESYLQKHNTEIQASYQASKLFWERLPASSKVPRLRPTSLIERHELMVDMPVYVLGGSLSKGIADNFRGAKPEYVPGGDPATMLQNFEQVVQKTPADKLKKASAVLTFDRELFSSRMPEQEYVEATRKLLTRLNELGIKTTVLSPLKTWQNPKNLMDPEQNRIRNRRNEFWQTLCRFRQEGLITTVVDFGDATQANNTLGTNEALLDKQKGKPDDSQMGLNGALMEGPGVHTLNAQGLDFAVTCANYGINAAHGYDGGRFSTERYWPGGEDYELGKTSITGRPIEPMVAGEPLVDKKLRDEAAEKVKSKDPLDTIRHLDTQLMGQELMTGTHDDLYKIYKDERFIPGMRTYAHPARRAVDDAFHAVQEAKEAGKDVTELTREFSRLASSIYVKLARIAIIHARELFEDPQYGMYRKDAYEHAKRNVENAVAANNFYHFFDGNVEGVKKEWEDFKARFKLS
ncbi:MAG TPA: hypothetical protein VI588_01645 [Candidatus Gracilibacteria bacterium]|nr:hypothetical protein [Candidatus Gracilibacteria bacterium]